MAGSYYRFEPKKEGLERKARNALGQWTNLQAVVERVNEHAVEQLGEWAVEELNKRVRREEGPQGRTHTLERAVTNPRSSVVTKDGFEFLVAQRMYEQARYWRAIEHGSDHMVGRRLRLIFVSGGQYRKPDAARSGTGFGDSAKGGLDSAYVRSAAVQPNGSRAQSFIPYVTIRRPIQPYHYAQKAIERFEENNFAWYRAAMDAEMVSSGFPATASSRGR